MRSLLLLLAPVLFLASPAYADSYADLQMGKHIYLSYCSLCHGKDGKSQGELAKKLAVTPADLTSAKIQGKKEAELADVISGYGRKVGSSMPLWGKAMPKENINRLARYILSLSKKDGLPKGDLRRGMAFFKNTCVACHGSAGDGKGVLSGLIGIKMVDFSATQQAPLDATAIEKAIREGKGSYMPSWKETFNEEEINDLVTYVLSLKK